MFEFPGFFSFPLGGWGNIIVGWVSKNLAPLFDTITIIIRDPLGIIEHFLWGVPCGGVIVIFAGVA